jgi:hypothetical protein
MMLFVRRKSVGKATKNTASTEKIEETIFSQPEQPGQVIAKLAMT